MASIGSLTSSTSNSIRGYGGLASGLDRDELIEGMTLGTKTKINQQEQKKQKLEWMQEAVRTISNKMIGFHSKYTETLTSSSNLFSSVLWGRNKITTTGDNSKYVSISGSASRADAITIMGVKQRAQNAALSSTSTISTGEMAGTAFDKEAKYNKAVEGSELHLKVGEGLYTIKLEAAEKDNLDTPDKIKAALQEALKKTEYKQDAGEPEASRRHLSDFLEADVAADGKVTLKAKTGAAGALDDHLDLDAVDADTIAKAKEIKLLEGSAMHYLGLEAGDIDETGLEGQVTDVKLSFNQRVLGKTLTFSYNGKEAKISIPTAEEIDAANKAITEAGGTVKNNETIIKESIQNQLNAAFGKGRIEVDFNNPADASKGLKFSTKVPGGEADTSSIFKLVGGDSAAAEALGLKMGASTRKDLSSSITDKLTPAGQDENGVNIYKFTINDATFNIKEGATATDLMNAINNSGLGLKVSYQEASDRFTFTSSENGASGAIKIDQDNAAALKDIFGIDVEKAGMTKTTVDGKTVYEKRGQDAIVGVRYAGSDDVVELRRDSNTFTVDGLTISVKGAFGYTENPAAGESNWDAVNDLTKAVEVDASVDVDKVLNTIKSFVEDYNAIVDMVNTELTTKHDNDYDPLSDEQKGELSDSEIEKWEKKAKAGLLYGDSDLRNLSMDLRVVVSGGLLVEFEKVGISLSSNYSDNGKLSIDETKLRAALETNPESVEKLFTSKAGTDANGKETYNGIATNLKNVMDKYVKTLGSMETKGILIRKAGSESAAMSLTENYYYNQITSIDKILDTLNARLKKEQDRYISQFSALETMINNMNSQSSYLSSMY